jgi:ABC-type branched-subunit amino acid transport system substrate-binding protein
MRTLTRFSAVAYALVKARNKDSRRAAISRRMVFGFAAGIVSIGLTPATAQDVVKLGEIEAQTGSFNTYGWKSSQGVRMAVDKINKDRRQHA